MNRKITSFACLVLSLSMIACSEKKELAATTAVPLRVFKQEIASSVPIQIIEVGQTAAMQVTVKNKGNETWLTKGIDDNGTNSVALGFYCINSKGYVIQERRALLPNNLMPGASVSINVAVQSPPEPGNYKLSFSMVQEHVAWFYNKGAEPFVINFQVIPLKVFKQEITASAPLQTIEVDETTIMQITVKNTGNWPWLIKGIDDKGTNSVALGFYWIDSEGFTIDERHVPLPNNLMPGESVSLNVKVQSPPEPGNYKLHFSMINEHVAWFDNRGAEPFVVDVRVIN
jgi:uncharacterized protein YcfL